MINVDYFIQLYSAIAEKNNVGQTLTPDQQNIFMNQAQLQLMSEDYQTFFKTKVVTNFLQTYLKVGTPIPVPASTGLIAYPTDLQYVSSVSHYYNSLWYDSEYVDSADWDKIQMPNSLLKPTFRFTKYRQIDNGIEFAPKTIGISKVAYFKTPTPPIWNYTIVNNEPVYTSTGSVDFECDSFNTNRLMAIFLQLVGINLKDTDVAGFANQFTQQTAVVA
jgi:hypothetical protein